MLEEKIALLIVALEANTKALLALANGPAPAGAPAATGETAAQKKKRLADEKAAADAAAAATAGPSLQDFRDIAAKIVDAGQGKKLQELATKHGIDRVSAAHGTDKAKGVYEELQAIHSAL